MTMVARNRRALERQREAETEEPANRMQAVVLAPRHRMEGIVNAVVPQADVE